MPTDFFEGAYCCNPQLKNLWFWVENFGMKLWRNFCYNANQDNLVISLLIAWMNSIYLYIVGEWDVKDKIFILLLLLSFMSWIFFPSSDRAWSVWQMSITHSFEFLLRASDTFKENKTTTPPALRYIRASSDDWVPYLKSPMSDTCAKIIHVCLQQFAGCRARSKPGALFAGLCH